MGHMKCHECGGSREAYGSFAHREHRKQPRHSCVGAVRV